MNTATVAAILGISQSTLKRWIKQLHLPIPRNDHGHYFFNEEEITLLKQICTQVQSGVSLNEIVVTKKKVVRKGRVLTEDEPVIEMLNEKVNDLNRKVNEKADRVVSYQLLTHRREIDELENKISELTKHVEQLEKRLGEKDRNKESLSSPVLKNVKEKRRLRKKNILTMFFGF